MKRCALLLVLLAAFSGSANVAPVAQAQETRTLVVEPGPLSGVYKNLRRGIVALVFRCTVADGSAGTTSEADELRWLSAEEVEKHMAEAYAIRMLDALAEGPAAVRTHDGIALSRG